MQIPARDVGVGKNAIGGRVQDELRRALGEPQGRVAVVDAWTFDEPNTKAAKAVLASLGIEGRVLVVLGPQDHAAALSFRNLPEVHLLEAGQLNAYDILVNDWVLFSSASLPGAADAPAKPVKTAKVADAAAAPADGVDEDDKDGES